MLRSFIFGLVLTYFSKKSPHQFDGYLYRWGMNCNVYMYYWKEESKIPLFKACHAVELAYVFYNIDETIYTGEKADEELARNISTVWVNFAKTGNPSLENIPWNRYNEEDRKTITLKVGNIKVFIFAVMF